MLIPKMLDVCLLDVNLSDFMVNVNIICVTMPLHSLDKIIDWLSNENWLSANL